VLAGSLVPGRSGAGRLARGLIGPLAAWPYRSGPRYRLDRPAALAVAGGAVWVASPGTDSVTELSAGTGVLLRILSGPRYGFAGPAGLAVAGLRLWVTDQAGDEVTALRRGTAPGAAPGPAGGSRPCPSGAGQSTFLRCR